MARIVGLDLGTHSVKIVHVQARGRGGDYEVVTYDQAPVPTLKESAGQTLAERHEIALNVLRERGSLHGDVFITGLPGDAASVRTLAFPFSDARKIGQVLPGELEADIPFDIEDIVISWTLLGPRPIDGQTEVLVAFARRAAVQELLDLLAKVGVDPRHVEFDALALDDLFDGVFREAHEAELGQAPVATPGGTHIDTAEGAPIPGVAMVDIGHRQTSVCVLEGDRVIAAHTILHGGADATRALARELGLALEDAERGKQKEAFIEVTGTAAQFPEQRQISDILKRAYTPIVRRLRQVFQASISTSRVRVTKVILTGGGSRVLNLDRHLSESLNVRTIRGRDIATRMGSALPVPADHQAALAQADCPEAAGALAYALSGVLGDKTRARIDFRVDDFAWRGELDFIRDRAASVSVWVVVILVLMGLSGLARAYVLGAKEERLRERQQSACEAITGQKIDSASRCLAIIQEKVNAQSGTDGLPDMSAVDIYLEVARRFPDRATLARKVTDLDITPDRVRIKANTGDFDGVDKIVSRLTDGRCFAKVDKGKARKVREGVDFTVNIQLDCAAAPGKPLPAEPSARTKKARAKAQQAKAPIKKPTGKSTSTSQTIAPSLQHPRGGALAPRPTTMNPLPTPLSPRALPGPRGAITPKGPMDPNGPEARRQRRLDKLKQIREKQKAARESRGIASPRDRLRDRLRVPDGSERRSLRPSGRPLARPRPAKDGASEKGAQ